MPEYVLVAYDRSTPLTSRDADTARRSDPCLESGLSTSMRS